MLQNASSVIETKIYFFKQYIINSIYYFFAWAVTIDTTMHYYNCIINNKPAAQVKGDLQNYKNMPLYKHHTSFVQSDSETQANGSIHFNLLQVPFKYM